MVAVEAQIEPVGGRGHHLETIELSLCCGAAEAVNNRVLLGLFRGVSRLGDWPLSVIVGITLLVAQGWRAITGWAVVSFLAVFLQKRIKNLYGRPRPCEQPQGPPQRAPIPDHGSFPSGHTLHAVMAAIVTTSLLPGVAPVFLLLAILMALSRVVLGVHYPSDVLAGAALGCVLGSTFLALI